MRAHKARAFLTSLHLYHSPNAVAGMAAHHGNPVAACRPSIRAAVADTGAAASVRRGAVAATSLPTCGVDDVDRQRAAVWAASGSERRRLECEGIGGLRSGGRRQKKNVRQRGCTDTNTYLNADRAARAAAMAAARGGRRAGRQCRLPAEAKRDFDSPPLSRFVFLCALCRNKVSRCAVCLPLTCTAALNSCFQRAEDAACQAREGAPCARFFFARMQSIFPWTRRPAFTTRPLFQTPAQTGAVVSLRRVWARPRE